MAAVRGGDGGGVHEGVAVGDTTQGGDEGVSRGGPGTDTADMLLEYERGINLFDAPDLADELFIGRDTEIQQMEQILLPGADSCPRRVLVLGGMGGIGKTQLSIAYAKRHGTAYSSVFWLNATSVLTLRGSFRKLAYRILASETVDRFDGDRLWIEISNWLCELDNNRWLLIFDNHDNPDEYNIARYYPAVTHGSIIVTTRVPSKVNGSKVSVRSLSEEEDSLQILSSRSGREGLDLDDDACELARRLDGHPLALATAGVYLKESSFSFSKYRQQYEAQWAVVVSMEELADYPTRTLYTTWELSFRRIQQENEVAAELLRFLAYFDPRDIWYGLFSGHPRQDAPPWFTSLADDEMSFEKAMRTLVRYCLVEAHYQGTGSYSIHVCVHDWTLDGLNRQVSAAQYWLAFNCVAGHVQDEKWDALSSIRHRRITAHAAWLAHDRFQEVSGRQIFTQARLSEIFDVAELLRQQIQHQAAEAMFLRALHGYEKALGKEHTSTLHTVNNLGALYADQGKLDQAELMYKRALQGHEKTLGKEHTSTLKTVNNLGLLYTDQGKLDQAEAIYQRALQGYEKALGKEHTSTLGTVGNLGNLYADQGKLDQAELMYERALQGYEKALGKEHTSTLDMVSNLGILYTNQGKLDQAEGIYQRALEGYEKALGKEHTSTLNTVNNLGNLYANQGKLDQVEEMYLWALQGYEKALGKEHTSTLGTVSNLGILYTNQGKLDQAEAMYKRALQGYEKALGKEHTSTLNTVNNLGLLYTDQGKLDQAEEMYQRALQGYEKALGPELVSIYIPALNTCQNLGRLQLVLGRPEEAKAMYHRAMIGLQKVLGPSHERCIWLENAFTSAELYQSMESQLC